MPVEVPFRSVCGAEPVCALLKFAIFLFFFKFLFFSEAVRTWSLFVQRWTGNGRQNSNDVCGIVQQAYGPLGFPTFPSLFSFPFSLFLTFFHISHNFPSPPLIFSFFRRFLVQATRLHVTTLSAMCHKAQDTETNATCCGRGFCLFLGILRHIQKKGPNYVNSLKRKVLMCT